MSHRKIDSEKVEMGKKIKRLQQELAEARDEIYVQQRGQINTLIEENQQLRELIKFAKQWIPVGPDTMGLHQEIEEFLKGRARDES
jgi:hypothetical protein